MWINNSNIKDVSVANFRNKINKKGGLVDKNLIELILAAAGVFLLIFLLIGLFTPNYDEDYETAQAYFENLRHAVESADLGTQGNFDMLGIGGSEANFYLIYFGDKAVVDFEEEVEKEFAEGDTAYFSKQRGFSSLNGGENNLCICYSKDDSSSCKHCMNLDLPARHSSKEAPWVEAGRFRMSVAKNEEDGFYEFYQK